MVIINLNLIINKKKKDSYSQPICIDNQRKKSYSSHVERVIRIREDERDVLESNSKSSGGEITILYPSSQDRDLCEAIVKGESEDCLF